MEIDREPLRASISLPLLNLLSRGECTTMRFSRRPWRAALTFEFKEGTLYPALHQLEKKVLVRSEWRTGDNGRERKYYSLTAKGRKAAQKYERQWQRLTGAVNAVLGSK